ncbi:MAG: O-antigen ligase family protein [Nitrospira sp.]|nr:O-antigen ligase family protein [Nitrospira sp.]
MLSWKNVQTRARAVAGWGVVALGFSIPISTSLDGILLVITIAAWIVSGGFNELPKIARENGFVLLLPGLFVLIGLGTAHGLIPFGERVRYLRKYDDLLFPLMFVPLFRDPAVRERGLWAFGISMGLTLMISLGLATGWVPKTTWLQGDSSNATVFKRQITHNILMAFAAFVFAEIAVRRHVLWQRYGLGLLALGAVVDVFMLVQGRTGQAILSVLIVLWGQRRLGVRGLFMGATAVVFLLAFSYAVSPVFQKRMEKTVMEMERAQVETVAPESSSVGLRMEWYKNTIRLIAVHPFVGVGTGSFAEAYRSTVTDPEAVRPAHPHNQYLLTAAELGIIGSVLLLAVFGRLWWESRHSNAGLYGELRQGIVVAMAVGCLFNSLLLDHTEGLLFAWVLSMALAGEGTKELL